ncbi:MAG: TonB-dependent siderophore receptor [Hylemonella sp.]|uniref:TonB-dependent siderophore receptor n=1 Tax=Hylemonella sp. TaxID=2066020 RepID=UPI0022C62D83|nr:TonB-dependent siderophore receptor [Hylemonella sp.]MCZ8250859.1 TonB-dependent siderophore receptor [Hylemonella sp.]
MTSRSAFAARPHVIARAARFTCASLIAGQVLCAAHVQAQAGAIEQGGATAATLPEVKVNATPDAADSFLTQSRRASVGKSRASIQDTPYSMSVIDAKQAAETGATSVESALLYSAGVYAGRYGFDTRGDWAAIRGLTPSAYVDGLRGIYGFYNNVRPEMYTLDRVEVLKGPSSALYGQAELGGIINAVSKLPQSTPSREVEVQLGSHSRKQVGLDMTGPANEDGTLLYRLVALVRDSDTQVDYVNDDARVLMPSLTWRPNADTSVTVLYVHQENDSKVSSQFLPSAGTLFPGSLGYIPSNRFAGEPGWDRYDTRKDELSLLVDQRLNDNWKAKANLRKTHSSSVTREIYTKVGQVPDASGNITRTIHAADRDTYVWASDMRLDGDLRIGSTRHQVAVGWDYQNALWREYNYISQDFAAINIYNPVYGTVDPTTVPGTDNRPHSKLIQSGVYVTDHMEWNAWVVSAALRRDSATNQLIGSSPVVARNTATTGQLGVMYRFANGVSPYASTSEAFVPSTTSDGLGGYLKPTTGTQNEVGVKYLAPSGKTSVAAAAFDIEQKNRVQAGSTPGGLEQVGSVIKGWEVEAKHRIKALELLGNYSRMSAINDATRTRLSSVAEETASLWGQYYLAAGWRVGLGGRYLGDVTGASGRPVVPSVTLYDAMVGYTTGPWAFRLNIQNLEDEEYVSWCRGVGQDCGYGARRNVLLTANYKF